MASHILRFTAVLPVLLSPIGALGDFEAGVAVLGLFRAAVGLLVV